MQLTRAHWTGLHLTDQMDNTIPRRGRLDFQGHRAIDLVRTDPYSEMQAAKFAASTCPFPENPSSIFTTKRLGLAPDYLGCKYNETVIIFKWLMQKSMSYLGSIGFPRDTDIELSFSLRRDASSIIGHLKDLQFTVILTSWKWPWHAVGSSIQASGNQGVVFAGNRLPISTCCTALVCTMVL